MRAYIIASASTIAVLALDDLRLRMRARRERRKRAAEVASVLSEMTVVNDVELPAPSLEWIPFDSFKVDNQSTPTLRLGGVYVTEKNIFIGTGSNVPAVPATNETKNYCAAVWKAYRSRVARKAINATT